MQFNQLSINDVTATRYIKGWQICFPYSPDVIAMLRRVDDVQFDRPSRSWIATRISDEQVVTLVHQIASILAGSTLDKPVSRGLDLTRLEKRSLPVGQTPAPGTTIRESYRVLDVVFVGPRDGEMQTAWLQPRHARLKTVA